jgi:hypothetical protein
VSNWGVLVVDFVFELELNRRYLHLEMGVAFVISRCPCTAAAGFSPLESQELQPAVDAERPERSIGGVVASLLRRGIPDPVETTTRTAPAVMDFTSARESFSSLNSSSRLTARDLNSKAVLNAPRNRGGSNQTLGVCGFVDLGVCTFVSRQETKIQMLSTDACGIIGRFRTFNNTIWTNTRLQGIEYICSGIMNANVDSLPEEHKKCKLFATNKSVFVLHMSNRFRIGTYTTEAMN